MSISNLQIPNDLDLFCRTLNLKELIAEKISNITGVSFGFYDPANAPYNTGDIVFYQGCIFISLIDNNLSVPTFDSTDWSQISNIHSKRILIVNNETGDDVKAIDPCSNYQFFSVDAAIDYGNAQNPTGGYNVILQKTGIQYSLSRDITLDNVSILHLGVPSIENDSPVELTLANNITVSGATFILSNIKVNTSFQFILNNIASFSYCQFIQSITSFHVTTSLTTTSSGVKLYKCYGSGLRVLLSETGGVGFTVGLVVAEQCGILSGPLIITDTTDPLISSPVIFRIYSCRRININSTNAQMTIANSRFENLTSTSNTGYISIADCTFEFFNLSGYGTFSKTGTCDFSIQGTTLPPGYVLSAGTTISRYQTTGPSNKYIVTSTYNQGDVVFQDGNVFSSRINNNIGIIPSDTTTVSWQPLTLYYEPTLFAENTLTPAPLTTGLIATADKLTIPALLADPYALLGAVTSNSWVIARPGVYQIIGNAEFQTTAINGQNTLVDFFIGLSSSSNIANALARTSFARGLTSNTINYPVNNFHGSLYITLSQGDPNLNVALSLYARDQGASTFNARLVKFAIIRHRTT